MKPRTSTLVALVALVAMIAVLGAAPACAPPGDRLARISAETAPLLGGKELDAPAIGALHAGDLVTVVRTARPGLAWKGTLGERAFSGEGQGELLEVRRSPADGTAYLFRGALGGEVRAPTADYLCHRMGGGADCPQRLRRLDTGDGGTVAFVPCFTLGCPLALARGRRISLLPVDGLIDARLGTLGGERVLFVDALVQKSPVQATGSLHVLRVGEVLERGLLINTVEKDIGGPRHHLIEGRLDIGPDVIRYSGVERYVDDVHKAEMSSRALQQTYRLAPAAAPRQAR